MYSINYEISVGCQDLNWRDFVWNKKGPAPVRMQGLLFIKCSFTVNETIEIGRRYKISRN